MSGARTTARSDAVCARSMYWPLPPDQYWAWAQPLAIAAQASAKLGSSTTAFSNIWRANSMSLVVRRRA